MTVVAPERLSHDLQAHAAELTEPVGLVPQERDRPLIAQDLLFYLTQTSMKMAEYMRDHGLFLDGQGLHFDIAGFPAIRQMAREVVAQREAGPSGGVWEALDLEGGEDADTNGTYVLVALATLEVLYAP